MSNFEEWADFKARVAARDGRRTSPALTEARTVLSRAETALRQARWGDPIADPAVGDVDGALRVAIEALSPFRRTGR